MRESPSPCASAAIMARGLVVPSAISPRIYRNLPSRPGKIGGRRKSPSPNVRAVERTTSRQDRHQPERRPGEVPSVGWPCPHSGRRRQLEDHALTIEASQPVDEHRERELPASVHQGRSPIARFYQWQINVNGDRGPNPAADLKFFVGKQPSKKA